MDIAIKKAARKITDDIPYVRRMVMCDSWHDVLKDIGG